MLIQARGLSVEPIELEVKVFNGFHKDNADKILPQASPRVSQRK